MNIPFSWRRIWLTVIGVSVFFGIVFVGLISYAFSYRDVVFPGVKIGRISVGGMEAYELEAFIQSMNDKLLSDGLRFEFDVPGEKIRNLYLSPVIVTEGTAIDLMTIDAKQEVAKLMNYGKENGALTTAWRAILSRVENPSLSLQFVSADKDKIIEELRDHMAQFERRPQDAGVRIISTNPLEYEITSSSQGLLFAYDKVVGQLIGSWSMLEPPVISIRPSIVEPEISETDIEPLLKSLEGIFRAGSITVSYKDEVTKRQHEWNVSKSMIQDWILPQVLPSGEIAFGLDSFEVMDFLKTKVDSKIRVEPLEAKFEINESGQVVQFQGSRPGRSVDIEKTYEDINKALLERAKYDEGYASLVNLSIKQVDPKIKTRDVNNLGITEVLGIGHSNFSGSPPNRIKNIRNAVEKLNGLLVGPGESFSAIKATEPFTLEGGYLPELVIKGDEIKPEIGGGLCQIGSTLFRMAMNSGMPISERRNHSLVVNYYNDLENGLPGTDATLYDPAPDFKFKNDTENAVLIQAEMNVQTGDLIFTLWGTSDGRKGFYDAPTVSRWIPYGETRVIKTTKLKPGERQCQHAYRGAEASFTYHRVLPDGTEEDRVFESYYRPLPEICLVGVSEEELDSICDPHEPCYEREQGEDEEPRE